MESRNPEEEMPDERTAVEKIQDEGSEPKPEPTESMKEVPPKGEEMDRMVDEATDLNDLLVNIDGMAVKSLSDLYRLKEMMIQFENKQIYEG